jgi:hypothetical protein
MKRLAHKRIRIVVCSLLLLILATSCAGMTKNSTEETPSSALSGPETQQSSLKVEGRGDGSLVIKDGKRSVQIDVRKDLPGCVGRLYDPTDRDWHADAMLDFKLLANASGDGGHYILLAASVSPNCNVQGQCGAADSNVGLLWLHLDPGLSLDGKQAFPIESCQDSRLVQDDRDDWVQRLHFIGDLLTIDFEEPDAKDGRTTGQVIYDRRAPEAGFKIVR